ncbi:uncharacterized protein LOC105262376 isoform X2 [Musca domestica]|nr:uncharacterized protein LOC105262376 isoform X2 [Musca domestica]
MSNLMDIFRDIEDQIDDLQRDTKFCLNNYDYHHKNNEYEILKKIQNILEESASDGPEFQMNLEQMKETIQVAQRKCLEVDEIIKDLGITKSANDGGSHNPTGNSPTTGHSRSFIEEQLQNNNHDENKENIR